MVSAHAASDPQFSLRQAGDVARLVLSGAWLTTTVGSIDEALRALQISSTRATVDFAGVSAFDVAGAWLVFRTIKTLKSRGCTVDFSDINADQARLLEVVAKNERPVPEPHPVLSLPLRLFDQIGKGVVDFGRAAVALAAFFGLTLQTLARLGLDVRRYRWNAFTHTVEQAGVNAVPIISLMSFLVGAVIAYQGSTQLRNFGADVLTVDLVAVSVLREFGVLITAIMVAGRSGSAYAAEIGAMRVHEEVDAMRALALDPMEILVVPRILGLVIALPLLNFLSDVAGLLGGMLACWSQLDITPGAYFARIQQVVVMNHFWAGMIKAPLFGYLIAMIGCYEGFRVEGSAESVGRHTTLSVVEAIFVVIVVDAMFSVFFVQVNI